MAFGHCRRPCARLAADGHRRWCNGIPAEQTDISVSNRLSTGAAAWPAWRRNTLSLGLDFAPPQADETACSGMRRAPAALDAPGPVPWRRPCPACACQGSHKIVAVAGSAATSSACAGNSVSLTTACPSLRGLQRQDAPVGGVVVDQRGCACPPVAACWPKKVCAATPCRQFRAGTGAHGEMKAAALARARRSPTHMPPPISSASSLLKSPGPGRCRRTCGWCRTVGLAEASGTGLALSPPRRDRCRCRARVKCSRSPDSPSRWAAPSAPPRRLR